MPDASIHPIKAYRERQSPPLTQAQFGSLLHPPVPKGTVSRWESGVRDLDGDQLIEVSRVTGIPASELRPDLAKLFRDIAEAAE